MSPKEPREKNQEEENTRAREELEKNWKTVQRNIEPLVGKQRCFTWYDKIRPLEIVQGRAKLEVPSLVFYEWLTDKPDRQKPIVQAMREAGLIVEKLTFVIRSDTDRPKAKAARAAPG